MSSYEKLLERCAIRLWHYHSTSRYGHPPKRAWDDLALVEKHRYLRAVEVILEEASAENHEAVHVTRPDAPTHVADHVNGLPDRKPSTIKLTDRQARVLQRLADVPDGAGVGYVSQVLFNGHPYLAKASARDCLKRLSIKGLCEIVSVRPLKYRISERGAQLLAEILQA